MRILLKVLAPREAGRLTSHLHTAKLRSTWPQRGVTQISIETAIHFQERNKPFKVSSPKRNSNHHLEHFCVNPAFNFLRVDRRGG